MTVQDSQLKPLIEEAKGIIEMCKPVGEKFILRVLDSGGKDSAVAKHIASQVEGFEGVVHVNTKTGPISQRHSQGVIQQAADNDHDIVVASPATTYEMLVMKYMFPGPGAHNWFYIMLKERSIKKANRELRKGRRGQTILYGTGIRRSESTRRADAPDHTKVSGSEIWINPLINWTQQDIVNYMDLHNLSVRNFHHSLDCACGAFAQPGERERLMEDPDMAEYITRLEAMVTQARELKVLQKKYDDSVEVPDKSLCRWGHGSRGQKINATPPGAISLCNDCEGRLDRNGDVGIDPDEMMLRVKEARNG